MAVSSSLISQIPTLPLPSSCPCRCGDVIAACSLEPRPSSCDPSRQKAESDWLFRQAEDTLGMMLVGGEPEGSRRKSEESLHRLWERIDLSEPDQLVRWPFLPKRVKDDVVLCQIAGLSGLPQAKQENYSQEWERLGREFEEREKFRTESSPATSWSSFTSFEDDDPSFDALNAPVHQKPSQKGFITNRILEDNEFAFPSLPVLPDSADGSYRALINSIAERARRQKRKLRELERHRNPQTGLSHQYDSSSSSSPKPDDLDRTLVIEANPADSSTISPNELSPRLTPSSFPELTHLSDEEKLSFTTAHIIQVYDPTSKLARRVLSSPSKSATSGLPMNPPSGHGLVTPISSPGESKQYRASTTKANNRGRPNNHLGLDHTTIGKRKRAVSFPSQADSPSPDGDGLIWSRRLRKRMWSSRAP